MKPIHPVPILKRLVFLFKNQLIYPPEYKLQKILEKFPQVKIHPNVYISDDCQFETLVEIWDNAMLTQCSIGKCTYIASDTHIHFCEIGRFCSIGHDVEIGLGKHPVSTFVSTYPAFYNTNFQVPFIKPNGNKFKEFDLIKIGNDVWIGDRVIVVDGVSIGDGAIIGAGAVVTKDVEPYTISAGIPAKPIRKRFTEDQISFLLEFRWWNKDDDWFLAHSNLFENIEVFINYFKTRSLS